MIVSTIANVFYSIFSSLFQNVYIQGIQGIDNIQNTFSQLISNGIDLICCLLPLASVRILLLIIIGFKGAALIYYLVMWILKKIPMINIH